MEIVLMANVIRSTEKDPNRLILDMKGLVNIINTSNQDKIKSPLTITRNNAIQGTTQNLKKALQVVFELEEMMVELEVAFKLSYVIYQGDIELQVDWADDRAEGLKDARKILDSHKKADRRFDFKIKSKKTEKLLMSSMFIYQHFVDFWKPKDRQEVSLFLKGMDYKEVAKSLGKDDTSVWRRERSLNIREYHALKSMILSLA
ncbi:hypothetical protein [Marinoscillum sp. MHG1-6]|uniref:hypothetical protein n=1 Tax=Marinoscillum sp. MHG1-6 TaxID=2959627 RepID=UPI0021570074|nr:hypothetical protein [Marinoscillum sp. MHG1-6]